MKTAVILVLMLAAADAFTSGAFGTRRSTMLMKKAGRGSKSTMGKKKKTSAGGGSTGGGFSSSWISMPTAKWDLSKLQNDKVELFETNLQTLKDSATNPNGAVSVLKHNGETFCFSSGCPSCGIPLTGAKVIPAKGDRPSPVISCGFCKSAYDLKSGVKTEVSDEEAGGGLFAGLAKNLFKASNKIDPLKTYQLGEKDGQILISLE